MLDIGDVVEVDNYRGIISERYENFLDLSKAGWILPVDGFNWLKTTKYRDDIWVPWAKIEVGATVMHYPIYTLTYKP